MKAALSVCCRWIRPIRPALDNSPARRSVIDTSVGHFMSLAPSPVSNRCVGRSRTSPPDCTPRILTVQPYSLCARLMLAASAWAAFIQA